MSIPDTTPKNGHEGQSNSILMRWVSELEQRSRESNAVLELNSQLQSASSTVEAYDVAANALERLFPGWTGYLGSCDWETQTLTIRSYWGSERPQEVNFGTADCQSLTTGAVRTYKPDDDEAPCRHFHNSPLASQQICQPVTSQGNIYGLISLKLSLPKRGEPHLTSPSLTESRLNLLEMIAGQLGSALKELSARFEPDYTPRSDRFENLSSRMYLEDLLDRELRNARLTNTPLSLLFFRISSNYAHQGISSDQQSGTILKKVGALLAANIRKEDSAALAGSDLFVVILKNTTSEQAVRVADRVTNLVAILPPDDGELELAPPPIGLIVFSDDFGEEINPLERAEAAFETARKQGPGKIHLEVY